MATRARIRLLVWESGNVLTWLVVLLDLLTTSSQSIADMGYQQRFGMSPSHHYSPAFEGFPPPHRIAFVHIGFSGFGEDYNSLHDVASLDVSLYCQRHGYSYVRLVGQPPPDRYWGYLKFPLMQKVLEEYPLAIFMDYDIFIQNTETRIEPILASWGFQSPQNLILQAEDPDIPYNVLYKLLGNNEDYTKTVNLNIGFSVMRNNPKVHDALDKLMRCSDEVVGCEIMKYGDIVPYADQGAWNQFIVPMFNETELIRAPCNESNGYDPSWGGDTSGCHGTKVSHAWLAKDAVWHAMKVRVWEQLARQQADLMMLEDPIIAI